MRRQIQGHDHGNASCADRSDLPHPSSHGETVVWLTHADRLRTLESSEKNETSRHESLLAERSWVRTVTRSAEVLRGPVESEIRAERRKPAEVGSGRDLPELDLEQRILAGAIVQL